MLKKFIFMLIASIMFSSASVEAAAIYEGNDKSFVEDFNKAAEKFGNLKLKNFVFIDTVKNFDIFVAKFENLNKDSGISIIKDEDKKIIEIFVVTDMRDNAEKIFKSVFATLDMPIFPYREGLKDFKVKKNSSNKYVKVSVSVLEVKKQKTYTLSFKL